MITRHILDWTQQKFNELMEKDCEPKEAKKDLAKAAGIGAIEGLIDASVIVGGVLIIGSWVKIITGRAGK